MAAFSLFWDTNMATVTSCENTLSPLQSVKKNAILFKLFWYKVFVHWKLKLLNVLVNRLLFYSIDYGYQIYRLLDL